MGIPSLPDKLIIRVLHLLDVKEIILVRRINKRFLYLTKRLDVWLVVSRRYEHTLPVGLDMTSASALERAIVSAAQLELRLSSHTPVPRAAWNLPSVPRSPMYGTLVGKYLMFIGLGIPGAGEGEGIICLDVQTGDSWRFRPLFDVNVRWEKMSINASREVIINGQVGIALTLSNKDIPNSHWIYFRSIPRAGPVTLGHVYSIPLVTMPNPISCVRFSRTKYLVGTECGEIAVVDLSTLEQWQFNIGDHVCDLAIYGSYLFVWPGFVDRITVIRFDPIAWQQVDELHITVDIPLLAHRRISMFPPTAIFHPETNDPIVALFTEFGGHISKHTLMPCITTFPYRKILIHIDHLEGPLKYDNQVYQAGYSRALTCGRSHHRASDLILSDVRDDSLVHSKVSIHAQFLQAAVGKAGSIQWDETTGIVCLEDGSGCVTILQL